jgi:predicted N-acyltransferase
VGLFYALENTNIQIYQKIADLPSTWNEVAKYNHFLQTNYLSVLEKSAPTNMKCFYIGFFDNEKLIGIALSQYVNADKLESFGERDNCFKTYIRNFIFRNFAAHVLFIGNNMITGENAYQFEENLSAEKISDLFVSCTSKLISHLKKQTIKIHIVSYKDFYQENAQKLKQFQFKNYFEFNTQPNMVFNLNENWKNKEDYIAAFSKKYRDQYKRSHKKIEGIEFKELTLDEVISYENQIYDLYYHVAKNAPFNTFFLSKNHFSTFKQQCGDGFKIFGYFLNEKLIGFHSILLNGDVLETYFLGYDDQVQKEKMLYLNMLYNMTEFGIENNFKKIIFGRTALEIKSSIGAEPILMSGFIYHQNKFLNQFMPKIFKRLEPETNWQQRHPFK